MDVAEITLLLGLASTDPRIIDALSRFDIDDRPGVKLDDEVPEGPVVELQDWVSNKSAGIEFGFDDEAAWFGLNEFQHGKHSMLLTQVYLYGDHAGVGPYTGSLPFGLQRTDDRTEVRSKLNALDSNRRSYVRDTWESAIFRITISYAQGDTGIAFVLCALREPPLPSFDYVLRAAPPIESFLALIGKKINEPACAGDFTRLGIDLSSLKAANAEEEEGVDFRNTYGFEIGFDRPSIYSDNLGAKAPLIFSDVVFYREREMDSRGWSGDLPLGLLLNDSPETVMRKVGLPADEHLDDKFTGYVLWHFAEYSLHVYYSTMDNWILRIRLIAPELWDEWQK
ncbi:MAG: hypothetical protein ABI356_12295 [Steroidobacteraceae bacterium]